MPWMYVDKKYQGAYFFGTLFGCLFCIFLFIIQAVFLQNFDKKYHTGQFAIEGNAFGFGENGHPLASTVEPGEIPFSSGITDSPRRLQITGCEEFFWPNWADRVFVAAPSIPDQITVATPAQSHGRVTICAPHYLQEVPVYIWAE